MQYNPNPTGRKVGDCAIRALTSALGITWEAAYALAMAQGYQMHDMPSSDSVWGAVLRRYGFKRAAIPNTCPECYTADEFTRDHPNGTYVLAFGGHVATVKDGNIMDSWDSSQEIPQYFYYKEG